jgi:hypothetical protein
VFGRSLVVYAGAVYPRCNEKREPAKRAGRGGAVVILQGPLMTCDLGRRVSRPPSVDGLCFISICYPAVAIRRTKVGDTAPRTPELDVAGTWMTLRY